MSEPVDPRNLRASDKDRDQIAEKLRDAAGEGRLTLAEVDERLDGVYKARTYAELEAFTADLPELHGTGTSRPQSAGRPAHHPNLVGGAPTAKTSIAIMSGATRKGRWVVPSSYTAFAMMGGVEIDLRQATYAEPQVTITAVAIMGGIDVVVPEDVDVVVDGAGIMGAFEDNTGSGEHNTGNRPMVRITGLAFWGGVEVRRTPSNDSDLPAQVER